MDSPGDIEQSNFFRTDQTKEESSMAKSQDVKKTEKKKPLKTAKEKKQAKQEKKKG
jgi:hypothetical protein